MKTDATIIQHNGGKYFGFISDFPAICAQSDTFDGVTDALKKCAQLYFEFMSKNALEIGTKELVSL